MSPQLRPLLHTCPNLATGPYRGGITTRVGFPPAESDPTRDEQAREASRQTLARTAGLDPAQLCWLKQVHGAAVIVPDRSGFQGEADALVSADPGRVLLVSVADCGPVLLWDPENSVHAAVHAGWRGTLDGVIPAALHAMVRLGASPGDTHAWIGPSIGVEHFEVGPEVAERFDPAHVIPPDPPARPRPHVDLRRALHDQLRESGVPKEHIRTSPHCTFAQSDLYWSYRRDHGICGRHLAYLTTAPRRP